MAQIIVLRLFKLSSQTFTFGFIVN